MPDVPDVSGRAIPDARLPSLGESGMPELLGGVVQHGVGRVDVHGMRRGYLPVQQSGDGVQRLHDLRRGHVLGCQLHEDDQRCMHALPSGHVQPERPDVDVPAVRLWDVPGSGGSDEV